MCERPVPIPSASSAAEGRRRGCRRSAGRRSRAAAARTTGSTGCRSTSSGVGQVARRASATRAGRRSTRCRTSARRRPRTPRAAPGGPARGGVDAAAPRSSARASSTRNVALRAGARRRLDDEREARPRARSRAPRRRAAAQAVARARQARRAQHVLHARLVAEVLAPPRPPMPGDAQRARAPRASGTWSCSSVPIRRSTRARSRAPSPRTPSAIRGRVEARPRRASARRAARASARGACSSGSWLTSAEPHAPARSPRPRERSAAWPRRKNGATKTTCGHRRVRSHWRRSARSRGGRTRRARPARSRTAAAEAAGTTAAMHDVVTAILGGGQGARLWPLTRYRAKPAVPVGRQVPADRRPDQQQPPRGHRPHLRPHAVQQREPPPPHRADLPLRRVPRRVRRHPRRRAGARATATGTRARPTPCARTSHRLDDARPARRPHPLGRPALPDGHAGASSSATAQPTPT